MSLDTANLSIFSILIFWKLDLGSVLRHLTTQNRALIFLWLKMCLNSLIDSILKSISLTHDINWLWFKISSVLFNSSLVISDRCTCTKNCRTGKQKTCSNGKGTSKKNIKFYFNNSFSIIFLALLVYYFNISHIITQIWLVLYCFFNLTK